MSESTLPIELRQVVDAADRSDVELTAKEIRARLTRTVTDSSFACALTLSVKRKYVRKKRPKVKRSRRSFVYVPGSVIPEVGKLGPRPRAGNEGFMARRRRLARARAERRA